MSKSKRRHRTRQTAKEEESNQRRREQSMAEERPPGWAQELLKQFADVKEAFEQKFDALNESLKSLKKESRAMINQVSNAEQRISHLEDFNDTHTRTTRELSKEVQQLKSKVTYLESQSRRNNLVFVGLKEGLLESATANKEMAMILRYILDLDESAQVPEVEQQHRALRPRPGPEESQRPFIVRMLKWSDRQRILKAARAKSEAGLKWQGKPFHVFQDLPADIQQQRAAYSELKKTLRGANMRFGLLHPSRLMVILAGEKYIYKTPEEARRDLSKRVPSAFG